MLNDLVELYEWLLKIAFKFMKPKLCPYIFQHNLDLFTPDGLTDVHRTTSHSMLGWHNIIFNVRDSICWNRYHAHQTLSPKRRCNPSACKQLYQRLYSSHSHKLVYCLHTRFLALVPLPLSNLLDVLKWKIPFGT